MGPVSEEVAEGTPESPSPATNMASRCSRTLVLCCCWRSVPEEVCMHRRAPALEDMWSGRSGPDPFHASTGEAAPAHVLPSAACKVSLWAVLALPRLCCGDPPAPLFHKADHPLPNKSRHHKQQGGISGRKDALSLSVWARLGPQKGPPFCPTRPAFWAPLSLSFMSALPCGLHTGSPAGQQNSHPLSSTWILSFGMRTSCLEKHRVPPFFPVEKLGSLGIYTEL